MINLLLETKATFSIQDRNTIKMGSFLWSDWAHWRDEVDSARFDTKEEVSSGAITFS